MTDNTWTETGITLRQAQGSAYSNAPAMGTQLGSSGSITANTWTTVDVTSYITGDGIYNFAFSTTSNTNIGFSSREGANAPELVIVTSGGATNTPTATATAGPSPTPTHTGVATPTKTATPTATISQPPTVTPPPFENAEFDYDGDGKRVKSTINGSNTTYFVGAHFELNGSTVTKYYYAGAQRIAMRTGTRDGNVTHPVTGTLSYLLGDHLGSTSLTTDAAGNKVSEVRYKAWGEVRYATDGVTTRYQYTGQFRYETEFGLYFYNARWYDSYLNHFTQPDSIVPDPNNPQAWDKYAYALNNPIRYNDPSGHMADPGEGGGSRPRVRVFYLNGLGGEHNNKLTPVMDEENEYNSSMYWIAQAVGEENLIHVPLFTNPYVRGPAQLEMYGEALGLSNNWTNKALDAIRSELENNPLGEDENW